MYRKYRDYKDEDIIELSKNVKSMAELLVVLNLRPAGGNYATIKKKLSQLKVDCSHWTGPAWNKEKQLKDWSQYKKNSSLKRNLILLHGHQCQECNLTEWMGKPIPLELDHLDGDRLNNSIDNLKLKCCNCHALSPTWRGRNIKYDTPRPFSLRVVKPKVIKEQKKRERKIWLCIDCGKEVCQRSSRCAQCYHNSTRNIEHFNLRKVERPSKEILEQLIQNKTPWVRIGKIYGVTDNAVRKWARSYGIVWTLTKPRNK